MDLKTTIFRNIPCLQVLSGVKHLKETLLAKKEIKKAFEDFKNDKYISISEENLEIFRKAFLKFIWYPSSQKTIAVSFTKSQIEPYKINKIKLDEYNPILICVEKNDLIRLEALFKHYREIGIKKFVIIDNESTDGTIEYLEKQKDVDLYICHTQYSTLNKEAWVNRVLAHYGFDKWYLYVDSDELFIYEDCENKKINEFVYELEKKHERRVLALLTEVYSDESIFSQTEDNNIIKKYCYYDYDTYVYKKWSQYNAILGGPRKRVFEIDPLLTKHPLFKFKRGDIQAWAHWQFPYKDNYKLKIKGALLHYKFLNKDLEKYKEIAKSGNYFSGSSEYKAYISTYINNPKTSFYGKHSKKYTNSKEFFENIQIDKKD